MLFHRWETLSHIISDTKLPWFTKTAQEDEVEYDFAEDEAEGKEKCKKQTRQSLTLSI